MKKNMLLSCIKLIGGLFLIWFFLWVITPVLVDYCPALAKYGNAVERVGINNPGVLYYNDVPVTEELERINRDIINTLPEKERK